MEKDAAVLGPKGNTAPGTSNGSRTDTSANRSGEVTTGVIKGLQPGISWTSARRLICLYQRYRKV